MSLMAVYKRVFKRKLLVNVIILLLTSTIIGYSGLYSANKQSRAIEHILIFINFTQQQFGLADQGIPPHHKP